MNVQFRGAFKTFLRCLGDSSQMFARFLRNRCETVLRSFSTSGKEDGLDRKLTAAGLISGVLCALAVFAFTAQVQAQADSDRAAVLDRFGGEQVEVCVATRDIAPGEAITSANATSKVWVADLLPRDPLGYDEAMGRQATSSIVSGEVLCEARFQQDALYIDVPEGLVAVSLPADEVNAVGGAVEPGMKVDIYLAGNTTTAPLASSVLVLATSAGGASGLGKEISWISVAVPPDQAQEFVAAANQGNLYFTIPGQEKEG